MFFVVVVVVVVVLKELSSFGCQVDSNLVRNNAVTVNQINQNLIVSPISTICATIFDTLIKLFL